MIDCLIIVGIIILMLTSAMSVSAVRSAVIELITEIHEKYTQIFFEKSQNSPKTEGDFTAHLPTFIPADFTLADQDLDGIVLLDYVKDNDFISYEQKRVDEVSMYINTEGVKLEELEFHGLSAKYYSNKGVQNLIWYDELYMYTVSSTLDKETVFKIAESIEMDEK